MQIIEYKDGEVYRDSRESSAQNHIDAGKTELWAKVDAQDMVDLKLTNDINPKIDGYKNKAGLHIVVGAHVGMTVWDQVADKHSGFLYEPIVAEAILQATKASLTGSFTPAEAEKLAAATKLLGDFSVKHLKSNDFQFSDNERQQLVGAFDLARKEGLRGR